MARLLSFPIWIALVGGCSGSADPAVPDCIELSDEPCTELYPATWENVYANTLAPKCAVAGGACHGTGEAQGAQGGLLFESLEASHERLVSGGWITPGDPSCSPLLVRLEIDDPDLRMPPGAEPLAASERCSIKKWITEGAAP